MQLIRAYLSVIRRRAYYINWRSQFQACNYECNLFVQRYRSTRNANILIDCIRVYLGNGFRSRCGGCGVSVDLCIGSWMLCVCCVYVHRVFGCFDQCAFAWPPVKLIDKVVCVRAFVFVCVSVCVRLIGKVSTS